jgi:hypothetical protein
MLAKPSSRRSLLGALCVLGSFSVLACGSKQAPPPNPALAAAQNLHGSWRLQRFAPQKPLEQPFQGLLDAQLKALVIAFTGDTYSASGPGITLSGRYQVTTAIGDQFDATLFDPDNVAYPVSARFRGMELDFQSHNERWRGSGVLERIGSTAAPAK